jgi:hypothetical protein
MDLIGVNFQKIQEKEYVISLMIVFINDIKNVHEDTVK